VNMSSASGGFAPPPGTLPILYSHIERSTLPLQAVSGWYVEVLSRGRLLGV